MSVPLQSASSPWAPHSANIQLNDHAIFATQLLFSNQCCGSESGSFSQRYGSGFFVGQTSTSWRSLTKIAGIHTGSGSIIQRYGSADPDPYTKISWIRNTASNGTKIPKKQCGWLNQRYANSWGSLSKIIFLCTFRRIWCTDKKQAEIWGLDPMG